MATKTKWTVREILAAGGAVRAATAAELPGATLNANEGLQLASYAAVDTAAPARHPNGTTYYVAEDGHDRTAVIVRLPD